MPSFHCPEYDEAFGNFFSEMIHDLAVAQNPILEGIRLETAEGAVSSVVDSRQGPRLDLEAAPIGIEVAWDREDLLDGNSDPLLLTADASAKEFGDQLVGQLITTLDAVTDSTGNVVEAGGQKLSFELIVETLEKIEFSLDENDELVMPSLLMHPDTARNLPAEATPEQEKVLNDLKRRKREELLAKRRRRRLS